MKSTQPKSLSSRRLSRYIAFAAMVALALPGKPFAEAQKEGYYKDIFVDCGLHLVGTIDEWGMNHMGLSMDFTYTLKQDVQNNIMVQGITGWKDDNGALLYPDGAPRFRMMYVHGGDSKTHGASLGAAGRQRIKDFVANGGSYAGSCAGWYLASEGDSLNDKYQYYGIWPAHVVRTHLMIDSGMGWTLPENSPLLKYNDYGGDHYVANLRHWNGPYTISDDPDYWTPGTEVLARYDYPSEPMHGHVSMAAFKQNAETGRLVMIGSHPEKFPGGERQAVFEAALSYALEGQGTPRIKGELKEGVLRQMNNNATVGHEKIGDKQYHHFLVQVYPGTTTLTVSLNGEAGYDLYLYAKLGSFAFKGDSGVSVANTAGATKTLTLKNPAPGTWYVGVKCNTTVISDTAKYIGNLGVFYDTRYSGKTEVLNGVAYSIKFNQVGGVVAISGRDHAIANEYSKLLGNSSLPDLDQRNISLTLYGSAGNRVSQYNGLGRGLQPFLKEKVSAQGKLFYKLQLRDADKSGYEGNLILRP